MTQQIITIRTPKSYYHRYPASQRPPYHGKPLPFRVGNVTQTYKRDINSPNRFENISSQASDANGENKIRNRALSKVYDQLSQAESLRVAWLERQKSLDLAASAIRVMITSARAIKRRDPRFLRKLLRKRPELSDVAKTPADLWLAYNFGVVPTISDLHHAMGIFTTALPPIRISATASGKCKFNSRSRFMYGGGFEWNEGAWGEYNYRVKLGGHITSFDPHLQLATSLGFGQPLSVAWEMTPFSWVVDYVVNVGEFVKNFEPRFPGINVSGMYTSSKKKGAGHWSIFAGPTERVRITESCEFEWFVRTLGWPGFTLTFTNPLDLNGRKVSYLAAVLVQQLVGLNKK